MLSLLSTEIRYTGVLYCFTTTQAASWLKQTKDTLVHMILRLV